MGGRLPFVTAGFSEAGEPIAAMAFRRGRHPVPTSAVPAPTSLVDEPCIYGGMILHQYGHFLVETLARYADLLGSGRTIVWHAPPSVPKLSDWGRSIFSLLGLPTPAVVIVEPTRFGDLIVPEPQSVLFVRFESSLAEALGVRAFGKPTRGRQVWLSRAGLPPDRAKVAGEEELEDLLRERGWRVLRPEAVSVPEQLDAMSGAETIAGFEGSAFHSLLLLADVGARILIVPRDNSGAIFKTYRHVGEAKGLVQFGVAAKVSLLEHRRRKSLTSLDDPQQLAERLDIAETLAWAGDYSFIFK